MLSSHIFACQSASILYTLCYVVTRSDGFMKACARGQDSTTKLLPFTFWDEVSYAEANLAKAGVSLLADKPVNPFSLGKLSSRLQCTAKFER